MKRFSVRYNAIPFLSSSATTIRDYSTKAKLGVDDSVTLFRQMVTTKPLPSVFDFSKLLKSMNGLVEEAMSLFHELERKKEDSDIVLYNIVIDGLCKNGKLDKAHGIFKKLPLIGLLPTVITYNIMINGFCLNGLLDEAKDMLREMEDNGYMPDNATYNIIVQGFLKYSTISEMRTYLMEKAERGFSFDAATVELLMDLTAKDQSLLNTIPQLHTRCKK